MSEQNRRHNETHKNANDKGNSLDHKDFGKYFDFSNATFEKNDEGKDVMRSVVETSSLTTRRTTVKVNVVSAKTWSFIMILVCLNK